MAEQSLGSFGRSFGLDEIREMVDKQVEAQREELEYKQKAGELDDQAMNHMKDIDTIQNSVVNNMRTWVGIVETMNRSMAGVLSKNKEMLTTMKEITGEMKNQGQEQDKKKGLFDTVDVKAKRQGEKIAQKIMSPLGTVQKSLMNMLGPWGQAAAVVGGAVVMDAAKAVSGLRDVARTGGAGMVEGFGGVGQAAQAEMAMRIATTYIPFLSEKYASKQQMQAGAGTMFGTGGIRGGDLVQVLQELPKQAYKAGIGFENAAGLMARMNRLAPRSADSLLASFDEITTSAKEAGEKVSDFAERVVRMTEAAAVYGATEQEASHFQELANMAVRKHIVTQAEVNTIYKESKEAGLSSVDMYKRLEQAMGSEHAELVSATKAMAARRAIEKLMLPTMRDSKDAMDKVSVISSEYFKDLSEGRRDFSALAKSARDLFTVFGLGIHESAELVSTLEGVARAHKYSGPEIVKAATDFSKTYAKVTRDTSRNTVNLGAAIAMTLLPEFKNLSLTSADVNAALTYMTEQFNMSPKAIVRNLQSMARLSDRTDVASATLLGWQKSMATDTREMFRDPREAITAAGAALGSSADLMSMGMATTADYTKVLRTQMDVFGKTGEEAVAYFTNLSRTVETTNVRMSELSAQTEQLSKVSRQYGFDQTASLSLLVLFNSALRSGAASISDLQAVARGPGGAGEGFRALLVEGLQQSGGQLGQMFSQTGMLGAVDILLPDVMRYVGGEGPTGSLGRLGTATGGIGQKGQREAWAQQIGSLYREEIRGLTGGEETDENTRLSMFKRLSQKFFGQDLSAYGSALEKIYRFATGDTDTKNTSDLIGRMMAESEEENPSVKRLTKVQYNTAKSVQYLSNIDQNIQTMTEAQQQTDYARKHRVERIDERTRRKSVAALPGAPVTVKSKTQELGMF